MGQWQSAWETLINISNAICCVLAIGILTIHEPVSIVVHTIGAVFGARWRAGRICRAVRIDAVGKPIAIVIVPIRARHLWQLASSSTRTLKASAVWIGAVGKPIPVVVGPIPADLRRIYLAGRIACATRILAIGEPVRVVIYAIGAVTLGGAL